MSQLFSTLPEGVVHLTDFIEPHWQHALVAMCRDLLKTHPLMQPETKMGYPMALKISSWGSYGWFAKNGRYYYTEQHENNLPYPPIPNQIEDFMMFAAQKAGFPPFRLDTVLMNWYPAGTGKLGKHQDVSEQDKKSPIVTISLGEDCVFNIGTEEFKDKGTDITVRSGDVVVMGGSSRLAWHEVKSLIQTKQPFLPKGGRISLTGRQVLR